MVFYFQATLVHELIKAYGLWKNMELITPKLADDNDLKEVHSSDYIEYLKKFQVKSSKSNDSINHSGYESDLSIEDTDEQFGLGYDCPTFDGLYEFVQLIAGSTVTAANCLSSSHNTNNIAINWFGGWHHGQPDRAAGFCYVNDVAVGIQQLAKFYKRILYVDLDVHHGDGVENVFCSTKRMLTLSFHIYEPGFFPSTGDIHSTGEGNAKDYMINAPYKQNIGSNFFSYFKQVFDATVNSYKPEVFVIQCGADVLAGDPLGGANLIIEDCELCISTILEKPGPKLFLGGGGYCFPNTSRYWTRLTALILGKNLDADIPEHDNFEKYGPDFTLNINRKRLDDQNTIEEINKNTEVILDRLKRIQVE